MFWQRLTPGKIKVKKTLFVCIWQERLQRIQTEHKHYEFVFIQSWKQRNWLFSLFKDENQSVICPPVKAQMPENSTWVQERRICSILAHQACKTLVYVQITVGPCRRRRAQINWSGDFLYTYTSGDFWGSAAKQLTHDVCSLSQKWGYPVSQNQSSTCSIFDSPPTTATHLSCTVATRRRRREKKTSNTQDLQSVEVLLRADFVGSAFFFLPHQ